MKTNLTCEASSPVGTRLRMTATSLLDPFPAARLASRESLSRRTGRWRLVTARAELNHITLYRDPALRAAALSVHQQIPVRGSTKPHRPFFPSRIDVNFTVKSASYPQCG